MYVSIIVDSMTASTAHGLGFASRPHFSTSNIHNFLSDSSTEQCSSSSSGVLPISAVIFPVNAVAPPPVKSNYYRTISRTLLRNKRRTRRKTRSDGDSDGAEDDGWFFDGSDGSFFDGGRNGGDGGGGRGWNFDSFGGENWDEPSYSGFAFDFVYEVLGWIALSNCVHFAFKKVIRIVAGGIVDADREKAPIRLSSVC